MQVPLRKKLILEANPIRHLGRERASLDRDKERGEGACSSSWEKDQHINFWVEDEMERLLFNNT